MTGLITPMGMGWLPDYPSIRDHTPEEASVKPLLAAVGGAGTAQAGAVPASVDLRPW